LEKGAGYEGLPAAQELSGLDIRILRLVARGWPNAAIGRYVHHSRHGVAKRLARITRVIGARNREHAAALAVLLGQVTPRHLPGVPPVRPDLSPADADVLIAAVAGSTTREIARDLGRIYGQVHHARRRLAHAFNAGAAAEVAAAAVLLDAVTARMVDSRFPDVPLSSLTAHARELAS
jgi:DNA-binding CsgD family transcriptional regulator